MRLGIFMMPVHPAARSFTDTLAEDDAKSLYADSLGFDELWVGEHFSASTEPIPSPLMFMAGLVPRTKNLHFGTAVICLPNHDPVKVAAEIAQFDHMSRGRFMLGIGPGGLYSDFELFGNADRGARARKTMESIRLIQAIWAQDPPYEFAGEFWNISLKDAIIPKLGIGYMPKPFRQIGPADFDVGVEPQFADGPRCRAAGLGHHYRQPCADCCRRLALADVRQDLRRSRPAGARRELARRAQRHGGASDAEAHDRVFGEQGSNRYFYTYMREVLSKVGLLSVLKSDPDMPDDKATVEAITEGCVIYGSPTTMLDKLVAFRDSAGPFGTLLMTGLDWSGPNEAWERDSMRLLAQEVMPKFCQHVLAQAAE